MIDICGVSVMQQFCKIAIDKTIGSGDMQICIDPSV